MNSDGSNNLSLKYQSFTSSGCGDIGIRKLAFVAKTQFLCFFFNYKLVWCNWNAQCSMRLMMYKSGTFLYIFWVFFITLIVIFATCFFSENKNHDWFRYSWICITISLPLLLPLYIKNSKSQASLYYIKQQCWKKKIK